MLLHRMHCLIFLPLPSGCLSYHDALTVPYVLPGGIRYPRLFPFQGLLSCFCILTPFYSSPWTLSDSLSFRLSVILRHALILLWKACFFLLLYWLSLKGQGLPLPGCHPLSGNVPLIQLPYSVSRGFHSDNLLSRCQFP